MAVLQVVVVNPKPLVDIQNYVSCLPVKSEVNRRGMLPVASWQQS